MTTSEIQKRSTKGSKWIALWGIIALQAPGAGCSNLNISQPYTLKKSSSEAQYRDYSRHQTGRHVCGERTTENESVKIVEPVQKPIYKIGTHFCGGGTICGNVHVEYETSYKEYSQPRIIHRCCPGWAQETPRSYGCQKAICDDECLNEGKCVLPNVCKCKTGFAGVRCEKKVNRVSENNYAASEDHKNKKNSKQPWISDNHILKKFPTVSELREQLVIINHKLNFLSRSFQDHLINIETRISEMQSFYANKIEVYEKKSEACCKPEKLQQDLQQEEIRLFARGH